MGLLGKLKIKKEDKVKDSKPVSSVVKEDEKKVISKESESKTVTKKVTKKSNKNDAGKVLVRPFISEKAAIAETNGIYTFVVKDTATKIEIRNAVKQVYGVEPKKVRVMNMEGKAKRYGRNRGRRSDWKKAIATLPKGQSISIHEGV
ncbi:MAG: 50S ribosomal protein L23 [Candidatus Magasanikbacteria bacterium]|jgi:large subunit ribosomal protein L23|nr:50S ribosomal protein L23 [Candidatus Magasanikbacteria bacterium]MBT4314663.1 50S ribosomal protein L23 [Candidatus Magasanikbacteria bacterium]MBT4547083.1 50S ribosomal protein L23 [Candidatus Magasanikbacteria bacterium]MBT6819543.1 50S ribosomal protein L23 [Candidatus Magasanikbacteria bacterium]